MAVAAAAAAAAVPGLGGRGARGARARRQGRSPQILQGIVKRHAATVEPAGRDTCLAGGRGAPSFYVCEGLRLLPAPARTQKSAGLLKTIELSRKVLATSVNCPPNSCIFTGRPKI